MAGSDSFEIAASSAFKPKLLKVNASKTAIIVIDMQNEFCNVGGEGTMLGFDMTKTNREAIPSLMRLLDAARKAGILIVYTRAGHRPDLSDAPKILVEKHLEAGIKMGAPGPHGGKSHIRGTWLHEIIDELRPGPNDLIVDGSGFNKFFNTDMDAILRYRGIDTVILTGCNTDVCVSSTTRYAADLGYNCVIPRDAVSTFVKAQGESELKTLEYVFASVTTTTDILKGISLLPAAK